MLTHHVGGAESCVPLSLCKHKNGEKDRDKARKMSMAALSILTRPYSLTPSSLGLYDFNHHNRFNVINYKFNSSLSPTKSNNRASRLYHMSTYFSESGNFS